LARLNNGKALRALLAKHGNPQRPNAAGERPLHVAAASGAADAVNALLEAGRLAPQHAETVGKVNVCCCIDRGQVALAADFDKGAYAAGETARVHAVIKNDSKENVQKMEVKLVRNISLRSMNRSQDISDVVASANYPGVEKGTSAARDMALPFRDLLPSVSGRRVVVTYSLVCECDVCCAPNFLVRLTPAIYEPAPTVWGLAALGIAVPAGYISFGGQSQQQLVAPQQQMMAPQQPMQQQMMAPQQQMQQQMMVPQQQMMQQQPMQYQQQVNPTMMAQQSQSQMQMAQQQMGQPMPRMQQVQQQQMGQAMPGQPMMQQPYS